MLEPAATTEFIPCPQCAIVASVEWEAWISGIRHIKVACVQGHWFLLSADHAAYFASLVTCDQTVAIQADCD